MQYFKKGLVVAARKRKCLLNKMKVEIFQLMMNIPTAIPTKAELSELTFPKYSGARYNESAPKVFMKVPFTVLKRTNQNSNSAWYFLKCRNTNCTGKE
jgi:hypothetical protein